MVRFRTLTAGEYCLITGPNGRVIGVFRLIDMTAVQIVAKFGEDRVSEAVKKAEAEKKNEEASRVE